jgi:hypothetical protein
MKSIPTPALVAAFLFAVIALHGAQAQTQAKPGKLVTRDELRTCMNSEATIATRRKELEARAKVNGEEVASIRAEAEELKAERERMGDDTRNLDRFERKVKTHNTRVQAARTNGDAFRADLDGMNKSVVAHNEKCGGITFLPEDKEAILKEREAAKN